MLPFFACALQCNAIQLSLKIRSRSGKYPFPELVVALLGFLVDTGVEGTFHVSIDLGADVDPDRSKPKVSLFSGSGFDEIRGRTELVRHHAQGVVVGGDLGLAAHQPEHIDGLAVKGGNGCLARGRGKMSGLWKLGGKCIDGNRGAKDGEDCELKLHDGTEQMNLFYLFLDCVDSRICVLNSVGCGMRNLALNYCFELEAIFMVFIARLDGLCRLKA